MSDDRYLKAHRHWLDLLRPVGLVVAPPALVKGGAILPENVTAEQSAFVDLVGPDAVHRPSFSDLAVRFLDWRPSDLVAPTSAHEHFIESESEVLRPTFVVPDAPPATDAAPLSPLFFVSAIPADADFDTVPDDDGWKASPQQRLERLLREKRVEIGLLYNGSSLRLVYAPKSESSGHVTFPFDYLTKTDGRPALAALKLLLGPDRLWALPAAQRLPALLRQSRAYQNDVSTRLAEQVFEALQELVRGFQRAAEDDPSRSLEAARRDDADEVYGGLLTVLMRSVFLLYAEERDLLPKGAFGNHYGLAALFEELRQDDALHPDVMDSRFGAWARLLSLFRMMHDGARHDAGKKDGIVLPPRYGKLFDPDAYPFLEGRLPGDLRVLGEALEAPKVSDGVVLRVLRNLLILDGERISYRALDVEQIGSVYEAMMGYRLEKASGPCIAVRPKHVIVDLKELLDGAPKDRAKLLKESAECPLADGAASKLKDAETVDDLVAALGRKVSPRTPAPLARGDLYLQPTEERRRSGSHYTPRSLTAPIVQKTLDPQLARLGPHPTPAQILELKVCDPAMGSGAFLVEACRYLGEKLEAAWTHHKSTPAIPPDEYPLLHAQRLVAQRCLYGVDKNPFAVDLAKLSLWLATLAKDHPFTFLDHALRHGDSLVGVDRAQLVAFDWSAEAGRASQQTVVSTLLAKRLAEAEQARAAIHALSESDDVLSKKDRFAEAETALRDLRLIGDVLTSAFFAEDKAKARKELRERRRAQVFEFATDGRHRDLLESEALALREHEKPIPPFHWQIEFPEVFSRANPGFDAFVGNPPFAGKNTLIDGTRDGILDWLKQIHDEAHGNADLVSHFFRRTFSVLRQDGTLGLIATKTIAQGDTRSTGLGWICRHGGTIYAAERRMKWPGVAAVVVSFVHIQRGTPPPPYRLDDRDVPRITAFLFHDGGNDDPAPLRWNSDKSFIGSYVLGMGFTFDDENPEEATPIAEMHRLIAKDPRNQERIFPYIGGEEVNDSPTHAHRRYVINFGEQPESDARRWPDLMSVVEQKVKGSRQEQSDQEGRKKWWLYLRLRSELYRTLDGSARTLVASRHQPHWTIAFHEVGPVFSDALVVFALPTYASFAVLQSRIHEVWARFFSSSMKDDLRYTPSDCFETFPFPEAWETSAALEAAGSAYYEFRAKQMVERNEGLTKTYNRYHDRDVTDASDPQIAELRRLHLQMDRAVLAAYRWDDLVAQLDAGTLRPAFILDYEEDEDEDSPTPSRRKKPWRLRFPDPTRDDLLARLLALNTSRAAAERAADLEPSSNSDAEASPIPNDSIGKSKRRARTKKTRATTADVSNEALPEFPRGRFGDESGALFSSPRGDDSP